MKIRLLFIISSMLLLSACSIPAPKYSPSYDNVQLLNGVGSKVQVNEFQKANEEVGSISLRGNSLSSPYDKDLVHYLQVALESELSKAGLLSDNSNKKISALIEKNDIDASGFSVAQGVISAKFTVTKDGQSIYQQTIDVQQEWESSFMGAIAIPNAAEQYPKLVQGLLKKLYSDKAFIAALKT